MLVLKLVILIFLAVLVVGGGGDKLIGAVEQLHEEVQGSRKTLSVLEEEKDDAVKREQIKDEQIKALRHELEETQDERHVLEKIQERPKHFQLLS